MLNSEGKKKLSRCQHKMYLTCVDSIYSGGPKRLLSVAMNKEVMNRLQEILKSLPDFREAQKFRFKEGQFFEKEVNDNIILAENMGNFRLQLAMHKECPGRGKYLFIECWDLERSMSEEGRLWSDDFGSNRSYVSSSSITDYCFFYIGAMLEKDWEDEYLKFKNQDLRKTLFKIALGTEESYFRDYEKLFNPVFSLSADGSKFCRLYNELMAKENPSYEEFEELRQQFFLIEEEYKKCSDAVMKRWDQERMEKKESKRYKVLEPEANSEENTGNHAKRDSLLKFC